MLVTDRGQTSLPDYLDFIKTCAVSGVTSVQLREKNASFEFLFEFGAKLKEILTSLNIPLIINDFPELAFQLNAEGVHLGQTDGCPIEARAFLGKSKILGLSIETNEQLIQANPFPLSYVAASTVFPAKSKQNTKTLWGLEGLSNLVKQSKHPVVAIGGIDLTNVRAVLEAGASGIALVSAIHKAKDPSQATRSLRDIIDQHLAKGEEDCA
jgi:thiamine-phosphate pyrophosphorylase